MDVEQISWFLLKLAMPFMLLVLLNYKKHCSRAQQNLPPSPKSLPLLGNLHQLLGDLPHLSLLKLSNKHGPLMLLQLGSSPTLVISSSHVAREIFNNHDLVFSGRPLLYSARRLSYEGNNISFAPYGEYWRNAKKIVMVELLSLNKVQSFRTTREDEIKIMTDSIMGQDPSPINLNRLMLSLINRVICRVAFGVESDMVEVSFFEILRGTQKVLGEFNVADFYPWLGWLLNKVNGLDARLEKHFKALDEFYDQIIKKHLDQMNKPRLDHEDFVDVLLRLQEDPKQRLSPNNNQIKGIFTDMFVAGSDTSASTLVWTMTELIKNPSTLQRAQTEVRQVAKGKKMVEESDLPQLTYLKFIIKESLRVHPPAPILVPRETIQKCTLNGYEIPAKTRVIINAKAIAMDSNIWGPNPNKFDPDRFLNSSIDYRGQDFELIPFGFGRRSCPGLNFAVVLVELALANLLFQFDWSLPDGMTRDDIDMDEDVGVTMHKKNPLILLAKPVIM